ncbi:MAG TPA: cytochrome c [Candidatus Angelobacter sp.]|nr:cytochrome c [Candidatus Angelobacter sp.]
MRYFLLIFVVCVAAVIGIAGKRGSLSRKTPLYIFPDMKRELKLRPMEPNDFFPNGVSSQLPPEGTFARSKPLMVGDKAVYPYEDSPVWTGCEPGTTNFVDTNPFPITETLLRRGQERFNIYCSPCHGREADGNGIAKKFGVATVANLQDPRIMKYRDGEIFYVITHGRNTMGAYGPNVPVGDRWAIIAYLRALQLSHVATINDVPQEERGNLKK